MESISLLIVDEAHNCVGQSPYAQIIRDVYGACNASDRPRVLGLTASPLINHKTRENLPDQLRDLEKLMDSRVVSVHSLGLQGSSFLRKDAEEQAIVFDNHPKLPEDYPRKDSSRLSKQRFKELNQLDDLYANLGPFAVALYCPSLVSSLEQNFSTAKRMSNSSTRLIGFLSLQEHSGNVAKRDSSRNGRSNKLILLEELLRKQITERSDAIGIVFATMRVTALALHCFFSHLAERDSQEGGNRNAGATCSQLDVGKNVDKPVGRGSTKRKDPIRDEDETCVSSITLPTVFQAPNVTTTANFEEGMGQSSPNQPGDNSSRESKLCGRPLRSHSDAGGSDSQFDDAEDDTSAYQDQKRSGPTFASHPRSLLEHAIITSKEDHPDGEGQFSDAESGVDETDLCADQLNLEEEPMERKDQSKASIEPDQYSQSRSVSKNLPRPRPEGDLADLASHSSDSDATQQARNVTLLTVSGSQQKQRQCLIRSGVLIGRTSNLFKRALLMHKALSKSETALLMIELQKQEQCTRDILKMLRCGDINVLIATSVVEEGVDVKSCSFVTAFDPIDTVKSYVQMKGRARPQDANFITFESLAKGPSLSNLQSKEKEILEFLINREKSFFSFGGYDSDAQGLVSPTRQSELDCLRRGAYRTKLGVVTLQSAMSYLYNFIMSQPKDPAATSTRQALQAYLPRFNDTSERLTLPAYIGDLAQREVVRGSAPRGDASAIRQGKETTFGSHGLYPTPQDEITVGSAPSTGRERCDTVD
jgi:superfamily II DNA or RNA helicase